jgi:DNA-directed RNA polymerase subunit H
MATKKGSRKAVKVKKGGSKRSEPLEEAEGQHFNPLAHRLMPKHEKLSEKEAAALRERYHVTLLQLPKISSRDAALQAMSLKQGDIIKITRKSHTAGETEFFRGVVDE